jgi:hypothetical protein
MQLLRIAIVLLALAHPTASMAAKVCLLDAANEYLYKFPKLKVLELPRSGGLFSERSTMLRAKESDWERSAGSSSLSSRPRWCATRAARWPT